jgi:hypothetical protein
MRSAFVFSLSLSPLIMLFLIEEQDTQLPLIQEMFPLATLLFYVNNLGI